MRRELFRTLDAPGKMRKAELGTPNEQGVTDVANPPAAASDAEEVAEVMEAGADVEPELPENVTMPEKAPNEPNLQSTQVAITQAVKPENAVSEPRERTQFAAIEQLVQAGARGRVEAVMPAKERGEKAQGNAADGRVAPVAPAQPSRNRDALPPLPSKPKLTGLTATILASGLLRR